MESSGRYEQLEPSQWPTWSWSNPSSQPNTKHTGNEAEFNQARLSGENHTVLGKHLRDPEYGERGFRERATVQFAVPSPLPNMSNNFNSGSMTSQKRSNTEAAHESYTLSDGFKSRPSSSTMQLDNMDIAAENFLGIAAEHGPTQRPELSASADDQHLDEDHSDSSEEVESIAHADNDDQAESTIKIATDGGDATLVIDEDARSELGSQDIAVLPASALPENLKTVLKDWHSANGRTLPPFAQRVPVSRFKKGFTWSLRTAPLLRLSRLM